MTLEVPEGWYGHGNRNGFAIGTGLNLAEERFDGPAIHVDIVDMPFAEATSRFAAVPGFVLGTPTTGRLDGRATTTFHAQPSGAEPVVLEEALGIGVDIGPESVQQIFVDLGSKSMLIRTGTLDASASAELSRTLETLRFVD